MTKKDQRDAGPKFAPMCAEKPKNSERAMTSREGIAKIAYMAEVFSSGKVK